MRFIARAIALGYPADCASKGDSYEDLLRTWNPAYGSPPPLETVERARSVEPTEPKARRRRRFRLSSLFFWRKFRHEQ